MDSEKTEVSDCTVPSESVPPEELGRYMVERDPHSEKDIARYVELEANDETVKHVEKVKKEVVLGDVYEFWDVVTDKSRWWVITNLTNPYPRQHFPSLDYTLSFHVGLMMRLRSRPDGPRSNDPSPFDDVFRRQEQAKDRFDIAVEGEDYQAVGMQLRECLISLVGTLRRRVDMDSLDERPQDANFVAWTALLTDKLCSGGSKKELRQYLKGTAKALGNWLIGLPMIGMRVKRLVRSRFTGATLSLATSFRFLSGTKLKTRTIAAMQISQYSNPLRPFARFRWRVLHYVRRV